MEKERKLASIQRIKEIKPIENADNLELAIIKGWQCVIKKGEFKSGDFCIYFEVDSLLPVRPEFEFLRKSSYNKRLDGFRIKTVKLRGQVSQGLALPVKTFPEIYNKSLEEGQDVTEDLGVRKYEKEIPVQLSGKVHGAFPSFIPKTDEERIQNVPEILTEYPGITFCVTEKLDGTSATYYVKDDHFGVCGRNWEFEEDENIIYNKIANKYNLKEKMFEAAKDIGDFAIQGEIIGPSIQKNKYKLTDHELYVFDVFIIDEYEYCHPIGIEDVCLILGLKPVPRIERNLFLEDINTIDKAVEYSYGKSALNKDTLREGIVIRSHLQLKDPRLGRLSFKVINPKFLLKYDE
jgi:RNA ligase (TIGR02306 family)